MYEKESSASYLSARLWGDGVIDPRQTRRVLAVALASTIHPWKSLDWCRARPSQTRRIYSTGMQFAEQKTAFFVFLESMPDGRALAKLWQELKSWAEAEGADTLTGPVNLSTFGNYRIRLGAKEDEESSICEPINSPYYESLLKNLELEVAHYTTEIFLCTRILSPFITISYKVDSILFFQQYPVKSIDREIWRARRHDFYRATVEIFGGNARSFLAVARGTDR
jgi:hypothetical protein